MRTAQNSDMKDSAGVRARGYKDGVDVKAAGMRTGRA